MKLKILFNKVNLHNPNRKYTRYLKKNTHEIISCVWTQFSFSFFRLLRQTQRIFKGAVTRADRALLCEPESVITHRGRICNQGAPCKSLHARQHVAPHAAHTMVVTQPVTAAWRHRFFIQRAFTGHLWLGVISRSDRIRAGRIYRDVSRSNGEVTQVSREVFRDILPFIYRFFD